VFLNATAIGLFTDVGTAKDRLQTFLGQAASHGVHRIVLLSSSSVLDDTNPVGRHHRELERQVQHRGLEWILLRPGIFNCNTLDWAEDIRSRGVVCAPFGSARMAPVDERDIAAVAAQALLCDSTHRLVGSAPVLSGPEVLTPADQARIISKAIGVSLRFEELAPEKAHRALVEAGAPLWAADGLLRYYAKAVTHPVAISPAVAQITGTPPRTFANWVMDRAAAFRRPTRTRPAGSTATPTAP